MNWITISLIAFICSVVTYLLVRKSQLNNIPNIFTNLAMFVVPTVILFFVNIFLKYSFSLSFHFLLIIFVTAIIFSYLGNLVSLIGIKQAPNPGYSLIISKSYVVLTSIMAVFLFNSPLTITNVIAIALILSFSALIMINQTNTHTKLYKNSWIFYTLAAFFCWGFLALTATYILKQGVEVTVYLFYGLLFASFAFIIQALVRKERHIFSINDSVLLLMIGIFSGTFYTFVQFGYVYAPNPGYISAVNAASISVLTLASAYFFKDELSLRKLIGIFGVLAGLLLLFF